MNQQRPEITVVIPIYNEAQILASAVADLHAALTAFEPAVSFEILLAEHPDLANRLDDPTAVGGLSEVATRTEAPSVVEARASEIDPIKEPQTDESPAPPMYAP